MLANPTDARLKFILKTYGKKYPRVVADVVDIIAQTIGEDRWVQAVSDASAEADPRFFEDFSKWNVARIGASASGYAPTPQFVEALVALVTELPKFKARSKADPIFPWIARELADTLKAEREQEAPRPAYTSLLRDARRGGTALALWYERTRPNLDDWYLFDALTEAKKWADEHGPVPQGEIVAELKDGWTAQKLKTQEQLSREGEVMQHCVASYGPDVEKDRTQIFSLRDKQGRPHVTIEVANGRIKQIQGKQNEKPDKKYEPYVEEFKAKLEEDGIDVARMPAHLQRYADVLLEHAYDHNDIEDEHLESLASEWNENTRSADSAEEWLKSGFGSNDARFVGALEYENVTPEEWRSFPDPVYRKATENGDVPSKLDEMIKVARMAVVLSNLASERREPERPSDAQTSMVFEQRTKNDPARLAGHDLKPREIVKTRHSGNKNLWPSIDFVSWEDDYNKYDEEDVRWLYPAEEWLAESFKSDDSEDEYVGPWFLNYFTPEDATDWYDTGIQDGTLAAELRSYRLTPEKLRAAKERGVDVDAAFEEFESLKKRDEKLSWAKDIKDEVAKAAERGRLDRELLRYARLIAKQVAEQVDEVGVYRNPKRTSRRRR